MERLNFSEGNKKLAPNTDIKFLIWNLPAVITCPYATNDCIAKCYARKAERVYPTCLPSRQKNLAASMIHNDTEMDFENRLCASIDYYMNKPKYKNANAVYFRIHESGDFYNKKYTAAWLNVINFCEFMYPKLHFVAYTKSFRFFKELNYFNGKYSNFALLGSVWDDTTEQQKQYIEEMGLPIYTADTAANVEKAVTDGKAVKCECKDCANCRKCFHAKYNKIECIIH